MPAPYSVISVPAAAAHRSEPMGSKRKFWYGDPDARWRLFKYNRPQHGEDWAEKIAAEVAQLLSIPHAHVELAECDGEPGMVTDAFDEGVGTLIHGNELLGYLLPDYPIRGQNFGVRQHTVENVLRVLENPAIGIPRGMTAMHGVERAADVFVGYLMLDALIGNTDRHHENWAIILRDSAAGDGRGSELAPTFDHASSLARELRDHDRTARLDGRDLNRTVERYLARAESRLYGAETDARPLSPLNAFRVASHFLPNAAAAWLHRLREIDETRLLSVVDPVPAERMSDPARRVAQRILQLSRQTLLGDEAPE